MDIHAVLCTLSDEPAVEDVRGDIEQGMEHVLYTLVVRAMAENPTFYELIKGIDLSILTALIKRAASTAYWCCVDPEQEFVKAREAARLMEHARDLNKESITPYFEGGLRLVVPCYALIDAAALVFDHPEAFVGPPGADKFVEYQIACAMNQYLKSADIFSLQRHKELAQITAAYALVLCKKLVAMAPDDKNLPNEETAP